MAAGGGMKLNRTKLKRKLRVTIESDFKKVCQTNGLGHSCDCGELSPNSVGCEHLNSVKTFKIIGNRNGTPSMTRRKLRRNPRSHNGELVSPTRRHNFKRVKTYNRNKTKRHKIEKSSIESKPHSTRHLRPRSSSISNYFSSLPRNLPSQAQAKGCISKVAKDNQHCDNEMAVQNSASNLESQHSDVSVTDSVLSAEVESGNVKSISALSNANLQGTEKLNEMNDCRPSSDQVQLSQTRGYPKPSDFKRRRSDDRTNNNLRVNVDSASTATTITNSTKSSATSIPTKTFYLNGHRNTNNSSIKNTPRSVYLLTRTSTNGLTNGANGITNNALHNALLCRPSELSCVAAGKKITAESKLLSLSKVEIHKIQTAEGNEAVPANGTNGMTIGLRSGKFNGIRKLDTARNGINGIHNGFCNIKPIVNGGSGTGNDNTPPSLSSSEVIDIDDDGDDGSSLCDTSAHTSTSCTTESSAPVCTRRTSTRSSSSNSASVAKSLCTSITTSASSTSDAICSVAQAKITSSVICSTATTSVVTCSSTSTPSTVLSASIRAPVSSLPRRNSNNSTSSQQTTSSATSIGTDSSSNVINEPDVVTCLWDQCNQRISKLDLPQHIQKCHVDPQEHQEKQPNKATKSAKRGEDDDSDNSSEDEDSDLKYGCQWEGCKVYGKLSSSLSWLRHHVLKHSGTELLPCIFEGCTERFKSQLRLQHHVSKHLRNSDACTANKSGTGTSNNSGTSTPSKNLRKKKHKRRGTAAIRTDDVFDACTMDGIHQQLVALSQRLSGNLPPNLTLITNTTTSSSPTTTTPASRSSTSRTSRSSTSAAAAAGATAASHSSQFITPAPSTKPTPSTTPTRLRNGLRSSGGAAGGGGLSGNRKRDKPCTPDVDASPDDSGGDDVTKTTARDISDTIKQALIDSQRGHLILHSTVIARRTSDSGKVQCLVKWNPPDILSDEWMTAQQLLASPIRTVKISDVPVDVSHNLHCSLYTSQRYRKHRRK